MKNISDGLCSVIWYVDTMQQLCISKDFDLQHISQNNDESECVCNSGNVCDSGIISAIVGEMSITVGEMSAIVWKLNMLFKDSLLRLETVIHHSP